MATHGDLSDNLPDREPGDRAVDSRNSLTQLATFGPSAVLFYQYLYTQLGALSRQVCDMENRLGRLGTTVERQYRQYEQDVAMLAACQRDTAGALNRQIEKTALHPAVEAVVALAAELSHLQACAEGLPDGGTSDDAAGKLRQEIEICCTVADETLANINAKRIMPSPGEPLDPKEHAVCGYVETSEEGLLGKIGTVVTPGILYRGNVLRQARVTVLRLKTTTNSNDGKGT
jgi:molecular chaperone GrpE (heat shock protein)